MIVYRKSRLLSRTFVLYCNQSLAKSGEFYHDVCNGREFGEETMTAVQLIVWLIIGAIAGTLASVLFSGRKRGYGALAHIIIGLIGALIGGVLFEILPIDLGLSAISISLEDILAAFVGSLLLLLVMSAIRVRR